MGINTRLTKATAQTTGTPAGLNTDAVAVTFTANEPTAANTQTIADGNAVTGAETGQWIANQEVVLEAVQTDLTALRNSLISVKADFESLYAAINAGE